MAGKKQMTSIADLHKKHLLMKGDDPRLVIKYLSTGIGALDEITGGGIPRGRVSLAVGRESAGKTLICQYTAAETQRQGGTVALIDAEQAFDGDWWAGTGVNVSDLILSRPSNGEEAVDVAMALVGEVDLILIDSMAALIPSAVMEQSAEDNNVAGLSRVHKKLFDRIIAPLGLSKTAILATNQFRVAIGNPDPSAVSFPGGEAQRFWSSLTMRVSKGGWIETGGEKMGFKVGVYVMKNKTGRAYRSVTLPFTFDGLFDYVTVVVAEAIDKEIIQHSGAWYRFPSEWPVAIVPDAGYGLLPEAHRVQGLDKVHQIFAQNPEALECLKAATYAKEEVA